MIKVFISQDTVHGPIDGDIDGLIVPSELESIPIEQLRYDVNADSIVDASTYDFFYIDSNGTKHIYQHDASWFPLACSYDDELVYNPDDGSWSVISESNKIQKKQIELIAELSRRCTSYITMWDIENGKTRMPEWRQNSWNKFIETYNRVQDGKTLTTEEQNFYNEMINDGLFTDDDVYSKCLYGLNWITECKRKYNEAVSVVKAVTTYNDFDNIHLGENEQTLLTYETLVDGSMSTISIEMPEWVEYFM